MSSPSWWRFWVFVYIYCIFEWHFLLSLIELTPAQVFTWRHRISRMFHESMKRRGTVVWNTCVNVTIVSGIWFWKPHDRPHNAAAAVVQGGGNKLWLLLWMKRWGVIEWLNKRDVKKLCAATVSFIDLRESFSCVEWIRLKANAAAIPVVVSVVVSYSYHNTKTFHTSFWLQIM